MLDPLGGNAKEEQIESQFLSTFIIFSFKLPLVSAFNKVKYN